MDTTLVTVTVLSMGMAAALSAIVWRMLRDERRRSEARVAALSAATTVSPAKAAAMQRDGVPPPSPIPPRSVVAATTATHEIRRPAADLPLRDVPVADVPVSNVPLRETPVVADALFVTAPQSTPWWNRLAVMAGLLLVGTTVVLFALSATRTKSPRAASPAPAAAATASETATPGLELLSLHDARTAEALTITGMVRNPRDAALRSRVAVTAYAFDDKGAFVASGRALLDVTALAPGDESPFVVTIPVTEGVARYRIGFRGEDGRVIAHVDKRQSGPMAANW
jgi:hypothetical protein